MPSQSPQGGNLRGNFPHFQSKGMLRQTVQAREPIFPRATSISVFVIPLL